MGFSAIHEASTVNSRRKSLSGRALMRSASPLQKGNIINKDFTIDQGFTVNRFTVEEGFNNSFQAQLRLPLPLNELPKGL